MAYQYTKVSRKDLARGIDARSAESAIPEGYAEDLQNVDTNSNGQLSKRAGYQGYYGYLPMRVESITHDGYEIKLQLNGGIQTYTMESTPVVVYGSLSSAQSGDFSTTPTAQYYSGFTTDIPDTLTVAGTPYAVTESRHGVNTSDVFMSVLRSTSTTNDSNQLLPLDSAKISVSDPYNAEFGYTIASDIEAYILITAKDGAGDGTSWAQTDSIPAASTGTITITAATHLLNNFDIIPQFFYSDGTDWIQCMPDSFSYNTTTGTVTASVINSDPVNPLSFKTVLSATDPTYTYARTISAGATNSNFTVATVTSCFTYTAFYINDGAGNYTLAVPDRVTHTDGTGSADTLSFRVTNSSASAIVTQSFYEYASLTSSTIIVTDNNGEAGTVSTSYTDTSPQLTVWGLAHAGAYSSDEDQEGHVVGIDTYKRTGEQRVVASLGGNLYTAQTRTEAGASYLIPSSAISLENRVNSTVVLGPAFSSSASTRTRSAVVGTSVNPAGYALVTAVEQVSGTSIKYTLSFGTKTGTLASAISTTSGKKDYLTVTGMSKSINNGTFEITAVDDSTNTITVVNTGYWENTDHWNESNVRGRAGVFTDQVTLTNSPTFLVGDSITSDLLADVDAEVSGTNSSDNVIVLGGITSAVSLPAGTRIFGVRSGSVMPVTDAENFVVGDMCTLNSMDRQVRVIAVNPAADLSATIDGDGSTATVTIAAGHSFRAGQKIIVARSGNPQYDGEQTVLTVESSTIITCTYDVRRGTDIASASCTIVGNTVELDETLTLTDAGSSPSTLAVVGRWIPVEAPTSSDDLPDSTYIQHFDTNTYLTQPTLRSTMVADNLYLTNGDDELMKFDGSSLYRAGLIRWQPQLFAQVDTSDPSIPASLIAVAHTGPESDNSLPVTTTEVFSVGDRVWESTIGSGTILTVQSVDTTNNRLYFVEDISAAGASGTVTKVKRFKYYFRLNAYDTNDNIIVSAVTGADDTIVELTDSGQIHLRVVGFPAWDNYDYDTLELEVFRTVSNTEAPFYRVKVVDLTFNNYDGYIDIKDGLDDDSLVEFDEVNVRLKGSELGTAWSQPPRAKHITSIGNRLVLGNIKGYQELDITMRKLGGSTSVTTANVDGKTFLLRKDNTDSSTTTNMVDRARYEFVDGGQVTLVPASDIATTSSTFTVTENTHGLVAGNWVYMFHSAVGTDNDLTFAGWWQIASADTNTFTINFTGHGRATGGGTADDVDRYVAATAPVDIPVWTGTDGNLNLVGANTFSEFTAMTRLAAAINCSMRVADKAVTGQSSFVPWVIASAGSEIGVGRLVLRVEKVSNTTLEVKLPAAISTAAIFVNGTLRSAEAEVQARTPSYPSRVAVSYPNYPELFDGALGDQNLSDSVIDVNSSDGQEVTGIIPFFGESAFGGSTVESVLVVFKTNSIYLVDVNNRQISKIQSRGLGCTAPQSIASVRDGIMFVNESGVYKLNRDQTVTYAGKNIERLWADSVNKDMLSRVTGHHQGIGQKYKLSVPFGASQETNNRVFVYDHQREGRDQEFGAWTQYTNHSATGWANLGNDSFFATTDGQVFKIRNAGDASDYRDDASAVDQMVILLRGEDYGVPGARKTTARVVSHFQLRKTSMTGTAITTSVDLNGTFTATDSLTVTKDATKKIQTVSTSPKDRRSIYMQVKYTNSTKDEDVILAGVDYDVALLKTAGVPQAAKIT
jgi:hypothetical protein